MRFVLPALLAAFSMSSGSAVALSAQRHPDFSGTWTLDQSRSDTGVFTPKAMTLTIHQSPTTITVNRAITAANGPTRSRMVWKLGSKPSTNTETMSGQAIPVTTTLTWADGRLTIRNTANSAQGQVVQTDVWSLSPDGTTLSIARSATAAGQKLAGHLVLTKRG